MHNAKCASLNQGQPLRFCFESPLDQSEASILSSRPIGSLDFDRFWLWAQFLSQSFSPHSVIPPSFCHLKVILYHSMSFYVILSHSISFFVILCHSIILCHSMSFYVILGHLCHFMSFMSFYVILCHSLPFFVILCLNSWGSFAKSIGPALASFNCHIGRQGYQVCAYWMMIEWRNDRGMIAI